MKQIKINLGCGNQAIEGWINVDYAFGARLVKLPLFRTINRKLKLFNLNWSKEIFIHDLRKKFPWKDNSIDVIYSSHTLEHLSKKEGGFFLQECHRVLKEGGLIRIIVPDLKVLVLRYINGEVSADEFIDALGVSYESEEDNQIKKFLVKFIKFPHRCMYDTDSLLKIMKNIGFGASGKKSFESKISDIQKIELPERTKNAVIIEGEKCSS
ncbi:MAG: methyltransferase domain-containing protein [Deltaproteobacteria bacterium]|nr:methyltransferase domain-containing protein [Deltaproteobacteria bacterium]MBW2324820.1 methyltransferase domain-containing protein [Deltaproteobacteria bacterium]